MDAEQTGQAFPRVTPLQQMIASCTGAILTSLMVTPLDVVKIRLQVQNNPYPKRRCFLYCNGLMDHLYFCDEGSNKAWYKKAGRFRGTLDAFLKIIRNEGIKSLWSGLPPTLVMAVPATVIYFTCYDQLSLFMKSKVENEAFIPIFAGIVARLGAVTVISPLELIRTKMQSKALSYKELHLFVRRKLSHDGWISLWRGWSSTVMRDVPFSAMYWYNFEVFKKWLCKNSDKHEPTFVINFAAGAVSGSIASIVTLPFDVVKTQKQTRLWRYEDVDLHNLPTSTWDIMKQIVSKHGISGLFAGLIPRLIKVAPACAIMVSTYEFGKAFFHQQNLKQEYHTSDCMDLK
ncbi:solute carrier family 25 member 40 isoform X3 [Vombatus ursinus]|uniref:Mitochondrial glutathione transporter SLC25A40 n=1 Tax=Vombatus ursinus TaxID=29139 RepID=A0A4X2M0S3_VOMUR|nr:solute carrier family 25 member 40 isoform X3 [Vombatus ursinus]XP_027703768.1 solute carrier family 25 member 40 isoform X3 [Vombatus ursinus]XP_027703769.1 solute carrier family 25 member 40 isoform X3 [Vombatus ursinus]XP_027703770.1 solute carrier family 25 member 40 isoform X3 [Vombatus ursinus]XP_027703771.1 solute carrier family 25 member 40 isoform X3 [Vombatus ursinus]XP_027703772.1 solute carrier family 25 member 40 isoform X3 [Vombatus ursinus]